MTSQIYSTVEFLNEAFSFGKHNATVFDLWLLALGNQWSYWLGKISCSRAW